MVIVSLRRMRVRAGDALKFRLGRTIDASRAEQWQEWMRNKRELPLLLGLERALREGGEGVWC